MRSGFRAADEMAPPGGLTPMQQASMLIAQQQQQLAMQAQQLQNMQQQMAASVRSGTKPQAGPLVSYYADLSSGLLPPENMRIEDLTYRVRIDPAGAITFQTDAIQIVSQYNFALRRIVAWNMNPAALGNAAGLVDFQVQEEGRNFQVFKRAVSMASVSAVGGAGNPAEFDGVYICIPGTQISVNWFVDTSRWGSLVGTTKEMGIQLIGDYVICRAQ